MVQDFLKEPISEDYIEEKADEPQWLASEYRLLLVFARPSLLDEGEEEVNGTMDVPQLRSRLQRHAVTVSKLERPPVSN